MVIVFIALDPEPSSRIDISKRHTRVGEWWWWCLLLVMDGRLFQGDTTQVNITRHGRIFVVFMRHRDMLMLNTPTSFECAVWDDGGDVGNAAIRKTYP